MDDFIDLIKDYLAPDPACIHNWILVSKTVDDTTGGGNMVCVYRCKCGEEKEIIFYNTTNVSITRKGQ